MQLFSGILLLTGVARVASVYVRDSRRKRSMIQSNLNPWNVASSLSDEVTKTMPILFDSFISYSMGPFNPVPTDTSWEEIMADLEDFESKELVNRCGGLSLPATHEPEPASRQDNAPEAVAIRSSCQNVCPISDWSPGVMNFSPKSDNEDTY